MLLTTLIGFLPKLLMLNIANYNAINTIYKAIDLDELVERPAIKSLNSKIP